MSLLISCLSSFSFSLTPLSSYDQASFHPSSGFSCFHLRLILSPSRVFLRSLKVFFLFLIFLSFVVHIEIFRAFRHLVIFSTYQDNLTCQLRVLAPFKEYKIGLNG
ncbi:hypothetical protein [Phaffia rhodozyma]|uniref:Uncharacterized protein n=1 Tax=Phaffia rhodozyma TaxID=264483 RepID=A0A0F7SIU4_PHARH|nr:hypothetical protein [Phaffia rhodozyma]